MHGNLVAHSFYKLSIHFCTSKVSVKEGRLEETGAVADLAYISLCLEGQTYRTYQKTKQRVIQSLKKGQLATSILSDRHFSFLILKVGAASLLSCL